MLCLIPPSVGVPRISSLAARRGSAVLCRVCPALGVFSAVLEILLELVHPVFDFADTVSHLRLGKGSHLRSPRSAKAGCHNHHRTIKPRSASITHIGPPQEPGLLRFIRLVRLCLRCRPGSCSPA